MNNLRNIVNQIVKQQLSSNTSHLIRPIHPDIPIKYNSFNICVGKQGSSKTTFFMTNMMLLSNIPNDIHIILYFTDNDYDETVMQLVDYITIPLLKFNYDDVFGMFSELLDLKTLYHQKSNGEIEQDPNILKELHVDRFELPNFKQWYSLMMLTIS